MDADNSFGFVGGRDGDVTDGEDVVVGLVFASVALLQQRVLLRHLAKLVDLNLASSRVDALAHSFLQEATRPSELVAWAVDVVLVAQILHRVFESVPVHASVNFDAQLFLEIGLYLLVSSFEPR